MFLVKVLGQPSGGISSQLTMSGNMKTLFLVWVTIKTERKFTLIK